MYQRPTSNAHEIFCFGLFLTVIQKSFCFLGSLPQHPVPVMLQSSGPGRGWSQTNFVELWSVFRPRLAEMAIKIWVMCQFTSDGVFRKDYGNRNRKHLWTWSPRKAAGGQNWRRKKNDLRCRSASESMFAGILDQNFQGFIDRNMFSDAKVLKIWQIYVLGVKYLTNVCVMYVMMYVVCAGRADR